MPYLTPEECSRLVDATLDTLRIEPVLRPRIVARQSRSWVGSEYMAVLLEAAERVGAELEVVEHGGTPYAEVLLNGRRVGLHIAALYDAEIASLAAFVLGMNAAARASPRIAVPKHVVLVSYATCVPCILSAAGLGVLAYMGTRATIVDLETRWIVRGSVIDVPCVLAEGGRCVPVDTFSDPIRSAISIARAAGGGDG